MTQTRRTFLELSAFRIGGSGCSQHNSVSERREPTANLKKALANLRMGHF